MRIAILDLYDGEANEGMRCIQELIDQFRADVSFDVSCEVFDVRQRMEIADLSFDIYISTGGPGSPLDSEGSDWEHNYFELMNGILKYNHENPFQRKSVFLICHSFQIFCRYYGYAKASRRKSTSFGVMPVHKTKDGRKERLFELLADPFYVVDSRDYQITHPDETRIWSGGGSILCIEKERPFIPLERAIMAIRFNESVIGMQFHPEVDPKGMHRFLLRDDKKKLVVDKYGQKKYMQMIQMLTEPDKIKRTYKSILPGFLHTATAVPSRVEV